MSQSAEKDVPVWCSEHMEPYCPRHSVENDRPDEGVTSVEPGCTCGGMAACPQCQERDAASAENDATMRERIHLVLDAVSDCEHNRSVGMNGACDYCLSVALVAAGCVIPPEKKEES